MDTMVSGDNYTKITTAKDQEIERLKKENKNEYERGYSAAQFNHSVGPFKETDD